MARLDTELDNLQQRHHAFGFVYAVVKKYSDDDAGHQAALLTYYGFLSLFPLLLVATSIVDIISQRDIELRNRLLMDAISYFPVIGQQLERSITTSHRTGLALLAGLLFALYGARGIADAVRNALDTAWGTPRTKRSKFPHNLLRSFGLLFGAGLGLTLTTGLASYATSRLGHSLLFHIVPLAINAALLYLICMYVFMVGTSRYRPRRDLRVGALCTVFGLLVLQIMGGYLISHRLRSLTGVYGQFALVLALMFWLYLQAQVFMYSIEANVVHTLRLWPRSLTGRTPTPADEKIARIGNES